ncbi:MAG: helix-turn-helix transcriptional regulator [Oscillospiraceae bacterium]|nr:helix-turn-helix transcriptional regulator [Oscillospiraceae bacterium]
MLFPRLLDLRQDRDMTQKDVAALLGIDQRVYSNYETGKREIPVRHLLVLADHYGVSLDYLTGRIKR